MGLSCSGGDMPEEDLEAAILARLHPAFRTGRYFYYLPASLVPTFESIHHVSYSTALAEVPLAELDGLVHEVRTSVSWDRHGIGQFGYHGLTHKSPHVHCSRWHLVQHGQGMALRDTLEGFLAQEALIIEPLFQPREPFRYLSVNEFMRFARISPDVSSPFEPCSVIGRGRQDPP
jgi:hypothetical protein